MTVSVLAGTLRHYKKTMHSNIELPKWYDSMLWKDIIRTIYREIIKGNNIGYLKMYFHFGQCYRFVNFPYEFP